MPSRPLAGLIIAFWLASTGWLFVREWWPWLRADSEPPFTIEAADEAAPQLAHWSIWRGDQCIGTATTRMAIQKNDTWELSSSVDNLELEMPIPIARETVRIKVPRLKTTQVVTRQGKLLSFTSRVRLTLSGFGLANELKIKIEGTVHDGVLHSRCRFEADDLALVDEDLEPIPLEAGSAMNPLQPVTRMRVQPGQRWKITHVDPFAEAVQASLKQLIARRLGAKVGNAAALIPAPKALLAEVQENPEDLIHQGNMISCHVVHYRAKDVTGRTWLRASDFEVLRQEVTGLGEKLTLVRED